MKNLTGILEDSQLMYHDKTDIHFLAEQEIKQAKEQLKQDTELWEGRKNTECTGLSLTT